MTKKYVIDNSALLVRCFNSLKCEDIYFLVLNEGYADLIKGGCRLAEALTDGDISIPSSSYKLGYSCLSKLSVFSENDYIIVRPNNNYTIMGFALMCDAVNEDVIAASDNRKSLSLIKGANFNIRNSDQLFESLSNFNSNWLMMFHSIHIDINLIFITLKGDNELSSCLEASGLLIRQPIIADGLVTIEYQDSKLRAVGWAEERSPTF